MSHSYPLIRECAGNVPTGIAVQDGNYQHKLLRRTCFLDATRSSDNCICVQSMFGDFRRRRAGVNRLPPCSFRRAAVKALGFDAEQGSFHPAYLMKKSGYNERLEHQISTRKGEIKVVQIAGQMARRIVSFKKVGQTLLTGMPLGMIIFGSRVDLIIPKQEFDLHCYLGQKVIGGQTILARG